jgi:hypothetical protein
MKSSDSKFLRWDDDISKVPGDVPARKCCSREDALGEFTDLSGIRSLSAVWRAALLVAVT